MYQATARPPSHLVPSLSFPPLGNWRLLRKTTDKRIYWFTEKDSLLEAVQLVKIDTDSRIWILRLCVEWTRSAEHCKISQKTRKNCLVAKGTAVQKISSRNNLFPLYSPLCDLKLKTGNQSFRMTFRRMMTMKRRHTKFGYKGLSVSKDIRTNIHWNFEPSLWPWHSNPICSQETPSNNNVLLN